MLVQLGAGLFFSALLVALSARASPEWGKLRAGAPAAPPGPEKQGHTASLALGVFGCVVGIPGALGFVPGNVLLVLGGMVATMTCRRLLLHRSESAESTLPRDDPGKRAVGKSGYSPNAGLWFLPLAWSVLAGAASLETLHLRRALGVQAVLGPAALAPGPGLSLLLMLAFAAGLLSAVFWVRESSSIARVSGKTADAALRWGEAALGGAAVTAVFFGPSVGALVFGPGSADLQAGAAGSYLLTGMVVAFISWARKRPALPHPRIIRGVCAALALAALAGAVLGP